MTIEQIVQMGMQLLLTGAVGWLGFFIKQSITKSDEKNKDQDTRITGIEKEINDLKADLPFIYVTREDYIRGMNNIDAKLDKIYERIMKGGD